MWKLSGGIGIKWTRLPEKVFRAGARYLSRGKEQLGRPDRGAGVSLDGSTGAQEVVEVESANEVPEEADRVVGGELLIEGSQGAAGAAAYFSCGRFSASR